MPITIRSPRSARAIAWSLACATLVIPCLGWGREGHQIIGAIAMRYLTPDTRAAVVELLGNDDLATAGYWADEIRSDKSYDWVKPLHYINVPRDATTVDTSRDCNDGTCVVAAIETYSKVVQDRAAPKEKRAEALKLLIHFVGDVHQPLHVSYADDRGGNSVAVTALGRSETNLHTVWDTTLIEQRTQRDWPALAAAIDAAITPSQRIDWLFATTPLQWADESLTITRRVYHELPAKNEEGQRVLTEIYYDRNLGTIEDRLAAAGLRLAARLNALLGETQKKNETQPEPAAAPSVTAPHTPAASSSPRAVPSRLPCSDAPPAEEGPRVRVPREDRPPR